MGSSVAGLDSKLLTTWALINPHCWVSKTCCFNYNCLIVTAELCAAPETRTGQSTVACATKKIHTGDGNSVQIIYD